MKKITALMALLALVVVVASPAYAQGSGSSIEVGEGDVEISDTTAVEGSIVQNCRRASRSATTTRMFRSSRARRTP